MMFHTKGAKQCPWIGTEVAKDTELCDHGTCVCKSDQERSMIAVFNELVRARVPLKTIVEHLLVGGSRSNGIAERADRIGKGQVRVLLFGLEAHLGVKLHLNHPIITWVVSNTGYIVTHAMIKSNRKTSYEKLKGKHARKELCEIGKKLHYIPRKTRTDYPLRPAL